MWLKCGKGDEASRGAGLDAGSHAGLGAGFSTTHRRSLVNLVGRSRSAQRSTLGRQPVLRRHPEGLCRIGQRDLVIPAIGAALPGLTRHLIVSRTIAVQQQRQRRLHRHFRTGEIRHWHRRHRRRHQCSRMGLVGQIVSGEVGVLPRMPNDGDLAQLRIRLVQFVPRKAQSRERRRSRRGNQHIAVAEQLVQFLLPRLLLQVQLHDLLTITKPLVILRRGMGQQIPVRAFHLRDKSAHVRQPARGDRPRQIRREAHDVIAPQQCGWFWLRHNSPFLV